MPSTATSILDGLSTSVAVKAPCRTVATANIVLAGLQTISGYVTAEGDRVLVKGQTDAVDNGIYVASTGNWTRSKDCDGNRDLVQGTRVIVRSTTINGVEYELTTANPIVIGTTELTFALRYGANATYDQTEAEIAIGVLPIDSYEPGDIRRFAVCDGVTDDTDAINEAAAVALYAYANGGGPNYLVFPAGVTCLVSGSLDFSGIDVYGYGEQIHIQATSAQFNVITSTGSTRLIGLRVHGGWDGVTAGQSGDILSLIATPPAFPYVVQLAHCVFTHAKKRHIYIERGGYTSIHATRCITAGLHALELYGTDLGPNAVTTVGTSGKCQFGGCPNGYGVKMQYAASISLDGSIIESSKGIFIGGDNRALSFRDVYQEGTSPALFLDWSTSSGIGINVESCFGGNTTIPYNGNWQSVYFSGNTNLAECAVPYANRVVRGGGTQATTTTTGGVSVTAASITLPPGTWQIDGVLQTAVSAGTPALSDAGIVLTTNVAATGADSSTSVLAEGADRTGYTILNSTVRLDARLTYQNTTSGDVTMYLRSFLNISAGTLAYNGQITATKLQ